MLKALCMQMALKVADIAHLAAKTEVHKRWTQQLTEEFFRQVWIHLIEAVAAPVLRPAWIRLIKCR